jgi:cell division protein ZipA
MPQLRWTLLCLGVLFIVLLAWFERRRQRQASGAGAEQRTPEREQSAPMTSPGAFREPALTLPEMRARDPSPPHDLPVVEIEEDSFKARHSEGGQPSSDRSRRSLPVMDSGPVVTRERVSDAPMSAGNAFGEPAADAAAMVADESIEEVSDIEDRAPPAERFDLAGAEGVSEARVVEQPAFTLPDVAVVREPIVEWPPDDLRRVVALRLVAPPPDRLAGRALRLALAAEGFVLGKFSIFHKPDDSGRAVLSAASLSKPGTFDMATMDTQRYGGLSLFAVLPGPSSPTQAFDELLATARNLNERLHGALQDERGGPLTPTRIASLRETVSADARS